MKFTDDGKFTLWKEEGTWEVLDNNRIKATLDNECIYKFNKEGTEAELVEPVRDPPAKLIISGLQEDKEDDKDKEDEDKDKDTLNVIEVIRLYCYKFNENLGKFERRFSTTLDVFKKQTD